MGVDDRGPQAAQGHEGRQITWHEWGEGSFRLAHEQDRPILLDISAVWCHWCHVMDETSYADPVVIDLVNRFFVPIRVDNDRRPDINERYNMGGWPTTVFLMPTGEILTGGTYIPPQQMRSLLPQVSQYYRQNKAALHEQAAVALRRAPAVAVPAEGEPGLTIVAAILDDVRANFDPAYGGFGSEPKFPHAEALELVLRAYWHSGDASDLAIVTTTLEHMAAGGTYDHVEGGFFRYSTTRDWSVPHFEKMLEGNAGLLQSYLRAWQVTQNPVYQTVARDVLRYLNTTLSDPQGGFFGSQDADEEYYALALADRRQRPAPFVDRTFYVDWNAQMCASYLLAAAALDDEKARAFALRTLDRLWHLCGNPGGGGLFHYWDGAPHIAGLLGDQVQMATAQLDAYQATGEPRHLGRAQELAAFCNERLAAPDGGYYDMAEQPGALGNLAKRLRPLPGNAAAARLLLRLHYLTGQDAYLDRARATLRVFGADYERLGYFAAPYALAIDDLLRPPLKVVIVGAPAAAATQALAQAALALPEPGLLVQQLDAQRDAALLAGLHLPVTGQATAYPCVGTVCLTPITDPQRLAAAVEEARRPRSSASE